jgi:hypothetical protein
MAPFAPRRSNSSRHWLRCCGLKRMQDPSLSQSRPLGRFSNGWPVRRQRHAGDGRPYQACEPSSAAANTANCRTGNLQTWCLRACYLRAWELQRSPTIYLKRLKLQLNCNYQFAAKIVQSPPAMHLRKWRKHAPHLRLCSPQVPNHRLKVAILWQWPIARIQSTVRYSWRARDIDVHNPATLRSASDLSF